MSASGRVCEITNGRFVEAKHEKRWLAVRLLRSNPAGRFGSTRVCRVGRDRSFVTRHSGVPMRSAAVHGSRTFMAAPAAEAKGGLVAVSVSSPVRVDRQQPLQGGQWTCKRRPQSTSSFRGARELGRSSRCEALNGEGPDLASATGRHRHFVPKLRLTAPEGQPLQTEFDTFAAGLVVPKCLSDNVLDVDT